MSRSVCASGPAPDNEADRMNPSNNPWQAMSAGLPESMLGAAMGQGFAETGIKAFQHFQNLDLGKGAGEAPSIDVPQLKFSPEALAKLQQDYIAEASQLWNQSLQANPTIKDKRFAGEACHARVGGTVAGAWLTGAAAARDLLDKGLAVTDAP